MTNSKYTLKLILALVAIGFLNACDSEDDQPKVDPAVSSAIIDAEVGGADQPNQVFIDFSSKTQTVVDRASWDLGFYAGSEFRVILNNPASMLAQAIDKTDLTEVTAEDTVGMGAQMDIDAIFGSLFGAPAEWLPLAQTWMDQPDGSLEGTAIAEVSTTAEQNKVYIINRGKNADGSGRGWMKARFLREGSGYKMQYAEINSATFSEIQINKDSNYNFNYVNFNQGLVDVEPEKTKWDICFTIFTNLLPIDATSKIPYAYKDFVIQNRANVEIAEVAVSDYAYEDFTYTNSTDLSYSSDLATIGSDWRIVAQPGSDQETGVNPDIFYVVKDSDNNYYKLKFTRMLDPISGERGYPQIQYDLLVQ
ncbi:HmuY family protein [Roseivirga seohaensis]|uniref:HmuY family protein n=1 Tax=Roseivirga seohaensis TaxID=1914963 RepID=UPI003BAA631D